MRHGWPRNNDRLLPDCEELIGILVEAWGSLHPGITFSQSTSHTQYDFSAEHGVPESKTASTMMTVLPYNPLHPCTIPHSLGEQIGCWYTSVNRKLLTSLGNGQFDRNRIKQIEFTILSFSALTRFLKPQGGMIHTKATLTR